MRNGLKKILLNSAAAAATLSVCPLGQAQAPAQNHVLVEFRGGSTGSLYCSTPAGNNGFTATAWSFGAQNPANPNPNAAGKVALQDLSITKPFDECSTTIFKAVVTGERFDSVILTEYDSSNRPAMTVQLTGALVNNYQLAGSGSNAAGEVVSFSFDRIAIANAQNNAKSCWDTRQLKTC